MCKDAMGGKMCCHKMLKPWGLLALRAALAFVFIYAGYSKLGPGHEQAVQGMAAMFGGAGNFWATFVGLLEVVGGLMVLLGVFAPIAAGWLAVIMVVAIFKAHWGGPVTGYFLPISLLGSCLAILSIGAGKFRFLKMQCPDKNCSVNNVGCCGDRKLGSGVDAKNETPNDLGGCCGGTSRGGCVCGKK